MGCSSSKSISFDENSTSELYPLELALNFENQNIINSSSAVAKVYRGNGFVQSGTFISEDGLFVTNYSIALEYFNDKTLEIQNWIKSGFKAANHDEELLLPGVSLQIEVEQVDVTETYNSVITENLSNSEIAQIKQRVTKELVDKERESNPGYTIQINELLNGQRYVLSKYLPVSEVRLVMAPPIEALEDNLLNSEILYQLIKDTSVLLRAYSSDSSSNTSVSSNAIPFEPTAFLEIAETDESSNGFVIGYPERSFRLDPHQALEFYQTTTNPNILASYSAFIKKEERLANSSTQYAIQSVSNRVNIQENLEYYRAVQQSFNADSILAAKQAFDNYLFDTIQSDSVTDKKYGDINYFLDQAYEIAHRQGASYYASSYFLALSRLDEFALLVRDYINADTANTEINLYNLIRGQQQLAQQISLEDELILMIDFLKIFNNLPEQQKPFIIQDIFAGIASDDTTAINNASFNTVQEMVESTVLFNSAFLSDAASSGSISSDPLFLLLDELIFTQEMSRNNQAIFIAYAQPAQKVYIDALSKLPEFQNIPPDANSTLRINKGAILNPELNSEYLIGYFNFTNRATGSAVLDKSGKLVGILSAEIPSKVSNNYLIPDSPNEYKIIPIQGLMDSLTMED